MLNLVGFMLFSGLHLCCSVLHFFYLGVQLSPGGILGRLLLHHQPATHSLPGLHLPGSHEQPAVCCLRPLHCAGHHRDC